MRLANNLRYFQRLFWFSSCGPYFLSSCSRGRQTRRVWLSRFCETRLVRWAPCCTGSFVPYMGLYGESKFSNPPFTCFRPKCQNTGLVTHCGYTQLGHKHLVHSYGEGYYAALRFCFRSHDNSDKTAKMRKRKANYISLISCFIPSAPNASDSVPGVFFVCKYCFFERGGLN